MVGIYNKIRAGGKFMKQEERRSQTKKLLLDTVKSLIQTKGCNLVTMADIMELSGLSKGAIFHYVKSKDELFAWVLQDRLEQINMQFTQKVDSSNPTFEQPMEQIANHLWQLEDDSAIANQVLIYLMSKAQQPFVSKVLTQFYEQSISYSERWIKEGQSHGVISKELHATKTAEMFVLLSFGFRLRSTIQTTDESFGIQDYISFIHQQLQGK
jgi:AcrR family transcriptional regulator